MDDRREEARRWVRRKQRFYTRSWASTWPSAWSGFAIDILTGTDDLWFYWPMLGAGLIVTVIGIAIFGIGGLFGGDWERRQIDKYLERRGPGENGGNDRPDQRPPTR